MQSRFNLFSMIVIAAALIFFPIFFATAVFAGDASQTIKIGVTAAHHDNVGQILRHFGAGVDFHPLSRENATNLESLKEFYAVFINCGSHRHIDPRILSSFVHQGGIVYASDHAVRVLQPAFPGIIEFASSPTQVVSQANIVHSTLASHMRVNNLDVIFDLDGWYAITNLDDKATVYIEGNIRGDTRRGVIPLAMSFDYGEGTVFYTSFHNSAQATSHMINFIEYLIFRIKNVEADRNLQYIARREGFVYRGAVFEESARLRAGVGGFAAAPLPTAIDFGVAATETSSDAPLVVHAPESFRYTFEGKDFMLMFGAGNEFYYVILTDPHGNTFTIDSYGAVTDNITDPSAIQPSITLEISDGYRIRVTNVALGEWSFFAVPRSDDHSTFMIGVAVMQ